MFKKITNNALRSYKGLNYQIVNKCFFCREFHKCSSKLLIPFNPDQWVHIRYSTSTNEEAEENTTLESKIIYNTFLNKIGFIQAKKLENIERKRLQHLSNESIVPISLKYLVETEPEPDSTERVTCNEENNPDYLLNLPYQARSVKGNIFVETETEETTEDQNVLDNESHFDELVVDRPTQSVGNWMKDYEKYSEEEPNEDEDLLLQGYGTPDPSAAVSQVPCGGCGAFLHCQDPSIPGYLPSEIYKNCSKKDLRESICQRCHFLKNYNTALSVTVDPEEYPKILSQIKGKRALVILLADLTDLPCSIWPGIMDIIGPKQPLFLVGNKIDMIPGDRKGWLRHIFSYLRSCLPRSAIVAHTALISAKTGFGVEELINKLHNFWQYKGDVYLVGCTNVGKSTLFNALLQSDYCKVKAVDLIQRATTAPWPGTTLNLLKFPILRPEGWRLYLRTERLKKQRKIAAMEHALEKQQKKKRLPKNDSTLLIGHIGRTFSQNKAEHEGDDNFGLHQPERFGLDPNDPDFKLSKWVYDTPGVLTKEQFLDLLTVEEVSLTIPKSMMWPRTYVMRVGWTLFVAGLARMDYIEGNRNIKVTIYSALTLPITITRQEHAEEIYNTLLGTENMVVPQGPQERLNSWPGLEMAKEVNFVGIHSQESCADVTLSSAGWVAVAPYAKDIIKMSFWTPKARGVHVRAPSLLPKAVALRGKKLQKCPAYTLRKENMFPS